MTSPLYPTFEKRVRDATALLLRKQVDPWFFMSSGKPFRVAQAHGGEIAYEGIGFEGSPRNVFWGRYIEPFLENLIDTEIAVAVAMCKERETDLRILMPELRRLLLTACSAVYRRMADVDQRLLGRGHPENVPLRPVTDENAVMAEYIAVRVQAELTMWKPTSRVEAWYSKNKFWVWFAGVIGTASTIVSKCTGG